MNYHVFRLHIHESSQGKLAAYAYTPKGEGRTTLDLPLPGLQSGSLLASWRQSGYRVLVRRERVVDDPGAEIRNLGENIFSALFSGEVLGLFERCLESLSNENTAGLRIELMFDPRDKSFPILQAIPWEILRQPGTPGFLALNRRLPIVRYLTSPRAAEWGLSSRSIRIVAVASSPRGMNSLDLESELQNLEAVASLTDRLEIVRPKAPTLTELRRTCLKNTCHVLHFMGHGSAFSNQPVLWFETDQGEADPVRGMELASKLADFPSLKLVFLNACKSASTPDEDAGDGFGGLASALVLGGMPAVIAMQFPVSDTSAINFSNVFYQRLAAGDPLEAAVAEGRQAVFSADQNHGEWATPVLFLRGSEAAAVSKPRHQTTAVILAIVLAVLLLLGSGLYYQRQAARILELNNRGFEQLAEGHFEQARESLLAALELDPSFAPAHANLSLLESKRGNERAALDHARAAAEAEPGAALHWYNLGSLLSTSRRSEEALESLQRAIRIDPRYAEAYNEIGAAYLDLDRPIEAESALVVGLDADPLIPELWKNLGRALLAQGRHAEAIARLEEGLRRNRESGSSIKEVEILTWLAQAHVAAHQEAEACRTIDEIHQIGGIEALSRSFELAKLAVQGGCQKS